MVFIYMQEEIIIKQNSFRAVTACLSPDTFLYIIQKRDHPCDVLNVYRKERKEVIGINGLLNH